MPRKKNRRKEIQKAKRAAQPKPELRHIGTIAHMPYGHSGATMALAVAAAFPGLTMAARINDKEDKDGSTTDP